MTGALALLCAAALSASASQTRQAKPQDELFKTLTALDAGLFESFNTCNIAKFETFFAEDVEFYHDRGGLTRSRQAVTESIKNNICGKVRRELVEGSLEVHPMDGFGALQIGSHRFCDLKLPKCDPAKSAPARFIHLWQFKDGAWKITRVISYDHST